MERATPDDQEGVHLVLHVPSGGQVATQDLARKGEPLATGTDRNLVTRVLKDAPRVTDGVAVLGGREQADASAPTQLVKGGPHGRSYVQARGGLKEDGGDPGLGVPQGRMAHVDDQLDVQWFELVVDQVACTVAWVRREHDGGPSGLHYALHYRERQTLQSLWQLQSYHLGAAVVHRP